MACWIFSLLEEILGKYMHIASAPQGCVLSPVVACVFCAICLFSFHGSLSTVVESLWYRSLVTSHLQLVINQHSEATAFWPPASDRLVFSVVNVINGILSCFVPSCSCVPLVGSLYFCVHTKEGLYQVCVTNLGIPCRLTLRSGIN